MDNLKPIRFIFVGSFAELFVKFESVCCIEHGAYRIAKMNRKLALPSNISKVSAGLGANDLMKYGDYLYVGYVCVSISSL